jgi:hypothetical protein
LWLNSMREGQCMSQVMWTRFVRMPTKWEWTTTRWAALRTAWRVVIVSHATLLFVQASSHYCFDQHVIITHSCALVGRLFYYTLHEPVVTNIVASHDCSEGFWFSCMSIQASQCAGERKV